MILILSIIRTVVVLVIPFLTGFLFLKKEEKISFAALTESYLIGQIVMWAIFQILSVPLVRLKQSFILLVILYSIAITMIITFSILRIKKQRLIFDLKIKWKQAPMMWVVLILVVGVIGFQVVMYAVGMHIDNDDSRWIVEANDTVLTGTMLLYSPATGQYLGEIVGEMIKDSFSPWPMYISTLSVWTGVHPAIIARTILAPLLLLLSYTCYYRIGKNLFKAWPERIIFLLAAAVISMFMGNGLTSAAFALTRIWQGKAIVASVTIPLIFSQFLVIQKENEIRNWLFLCAICCASCLLSGMGILISLIMIAGYGLYVIINKRWRRIPLWLLSLLPAVLYEVWSALAGG